MFKQCILFFEFLAVNSIMKVFGAIFILGKLHWKINVFFTNGIFHNILL